MKYLILLAACCGTLWLHAQELYPFTEPASNMPSHSLSFKLSGMFEQANYTNTFVQRVSPELMFGLSKKWMLHVGGTIADMYTTNLRSESVRLYAKYRFLSDNGVHKHFRMAAFVLGSYSRNTPHHNELNLFGDQSGVQGGLTATQLLNKLAVSGTASLTEVLSGERWEKALGDAFAWQAVNYSLSAGYLLLPINYTNYKQTNLNFYVELLGSRNLNFAAEKGFVDLAPAVQAIFNSRSKLSLGYRFQVAGDVVRTANRSVMLSYERIFLNALQRKE